MTSIRVSVLLVLAASVGCAGPTPRPETERRIAELERENADLRDQVEILKKRLDTIVRRDPISNMVQTDCFIGQISIDAVILDVKRDLRLVILNKGKRDEVKVGYVFDVYLGTTYKGQVRIQDVQEAMSSGLIVREMKPIARGDSATTSL